MKDIKTKLLAAAGTISGLLGILGAFGLCCIPVVAAVLGAFGLTGMFLVTYNWLFLLIAVLLIGIAVVIYKTKARKC